MMGKTGIFVIMSKRFSVWGLWLCWLAVSGVVQAQDAAMTQFYAAPMLINPAMTGVAPHYRAMTGYRRQWLGLPRPYETNLASFEYNYDLYNSGVGIMLSNERLADVGLGTSGVSLSYAYSISLSKDWRFRLGANGGYFQRSLGLDQLRFGDQIRSGAAVSAEDLNRFNTGYGTFGMGLLLFNRSFWGGAAVHQLNEPRLDASQAVSRLPARVTLHIGGRWLWKEDKSQRRIAGLFPALIWQQQGYSQYIDAGLNVVMSPIVVGAWYRGLRIGGSAPLNTPKSSLALLAGVRAGHLRFSYSYDLPVTGWAVGGAHEISLIIEPSRDRRYKGGKKWFKNVQCPMLDF